MSAPAALERAMASGSGRCNATHMRPRRVQFQDAHAVSSPGRLTGLSALSCEDHPLATLEESILGFIADYAAGIVSSVVQWLMLTLIAGAIAAPAFVVVKLYYKHISDSKAVLVLMTGILCVVFYYWFWLAFPQYRNSGLVSAREFERMSLLGKGVLVGKVLPFFIPLMLLAAACFTPAKKKGQKTDDSSDGPLEDVIGSIKETHMKRSGSSRIEELSAGGRSGSAGLDADDLSPH